MTSQQHFEKWRTIIGFSLVLGVYPLAPLLIGNAINSDFWNADLFSKSDVCIHSYDNASQLSWLKTAVIQYKTLNRSLPTTEQGLSVLANPLPDARVKKPLLFSSDLIDTWDRPYQYQKNEFGADKPFEIWSLGEDGINGTSDDIQSK